MLSGSTGLLRITTRCEEICADWLYVEAMRLARLLNLVLLATAATLSPVSGQKTILVEAESFADRGGFKLETQFIQSMGSPYLLAHGLGQPVAPAKTSITVSASGSYRVFVRCMDWVARWGAPGAPGRFRLRVGGDLLAVEFGTEGADWHWQAGGTVELKQGQVELMLEDATGFDGRCDAILLTRDPEFRPPEGVSVLPEWRRRLLGLSPQPIVHDGYDLVVVGGGYAGVAAALSAARLGCRVALIQDRGVLGGNGSSEVRVWSKGLIRRGKFPRIGEIVEEFADRAKKSPGTYEEFGDASKAELVGAEDNIDLFLNHHVYAVLSDGKKLMGVTALDTRTSVRRSFRGRNYVDATGHGTVGFLGGAEWEMTSKGRMGMSNMWRWDEAAQPRSYPKTPWALNLTMRDFPYPRDHHGQWFWESGFDKDPIEGAEAIRDWNLRAVFGAFQAMKSGERAGEHANAYLSWIAHIGGPRESRRLLGDVVLTQDQVVAKYDFPDGCVPSTWSIDLHYPKKQYLKAYPDNPFISVAVHDRRVDRRYGYPVPYRCFYSRNIANLFMAGRCISVTHEALGTVRVMRTCGMMGEVVGKAASICALEECTPREVYSDHLPRLLDLLRLPGRARAATLGGEVVIPETGPGLAGSHGPMSGLDPRKMPGVVVDDEAAVLTGSWTQGTGLKGYVGYGYRYAGGGSGAKARFPFEVAKTGAYEVRVYYLSHSNRGAKVPVAFHGAKQPYRATLDMRTQPEAKGYVALGVFRLVAGEHCFVDIGSKDAGGCVHVDAIQVVSQ